MGLPPFVLLIGALVLFLASTRQFSIRWRLLIWLAAALLLAAAAIENLRDQANTGLLGVLFRHPEFVAAAFQGNWPAVDDFVAPVIDVLVLLGAAVAIGCLIALTPGDGVERVIRPINIGLVGAVFGGVLVLAIAAVGFGPVSKRQVFIDYLDESDVIDGDTIRMGDVSLRLWGIDAPEDHQVCLGPAPDNAPFDCGRHAADAFRKLAIPGPVFCRAPHGASDTAARLRESFGRPLVACGSDQQGYGNLPDIGEQLVALGFAYPYESPDGVVDSDYAPRLADALRTRSGLHDGVFLKPTLWRNSPRERCILVAQAGRVAEADPKESARLETQLKHLRQECESPP